MALRHKSEIEHHRNKIRLRAKRKGHYDFPAMEDMITGVGDAKDQDHIYQKAQSQIDKILDPESQTPSIFREQKKRFGFVVCVCLCVCVMCVNWRWFSVSSAVVGDVLQSNG